MSLEESAVFDECFLVPDYIANPQLFPKMRKKEKKRESIEWH